MKVRTTAQRRGLDSKYGRTAEQLNDKSVTTFADCCVYATPPCQRQALC